MTSRDEQREQRRKQILAVGLELFIRKGFAGTRIQDIASAAGMSVGLLFHYFESKEKLYEELIELGCTAPQALLASVEAEPLEFFTIVTQQLLQILQSDHFTAQMFVLMLQAQYNEDASPRVKELLKGMDVYPLSARLLKRGQKQGNIRDGDPMALAVAFWGAVDGTAQMLALNPQTPCPSYEWFIDIIKAK
ncbi:MAG: TetR/AcrR family transcriptional regulator [Coriobacteriales bacterium]|nr:TetR/AcrR family transcriptional regulator [Coriobacteriales bacterium]